MSNYSSRAKERRVECKLCGRTVGAHNYSRASDPSPTRHKCPHGEWCWFSAEDLGSCCGQCRHERGFPKRALDGEINATCAVHGHIVDLSFLPAVTVGTVSTAATRCTRCEVHVHFHFKLAKGAFDLNTLDKVSDCETCAGLLVSWLNKNRGVTVPGITNDTVSHLATHGVRVKDIDPGLVTKENAR